jgi:hypothetical protein
VYHQFKEYEKMTREELLKEVQDLREHNSLLEGKIIGITNTKSNIFLGGLFLLIVLFGASLQHKGCLT